MEIIIKNLGAIKNNKQSIDLSKKFYVFVGDNNSGKTYVSQLLWTVFNQDTIMKFSREIKLENFDFQNKETFEIDTTLIDNILSKYSIFLKKELALTYNIENTPYQETILDNFSIQFIYDIKNIQKTELKVVSNIAEDESDKIFEFFIITKEKNSLVISFEDKDLTDFFDSIPKTFKKKINTNIDNYKKTAFVSTIIQLLLNHLHKTFFLPANRSFYPAFYQYIYDIERDRQEKDIAKIRELLKNRKKDKGKINIDNLNLFKRPYTLPINQLFKEIFELNKDTQISTHYIKLIEDIKSIMGGDIIMNSVENIAIIDFMFRTTNNKDLPMYMSSSSVNQLTLLYLYLKYWAKENANFLMIDEPEENLNPKNQIKLLDILLSFAEQNNNKVLITTHSPILAESVNNYAYLDVIKHKFNVNVQELIKENGLKFLNPDISISSNKIGVYFFNGKQIIDYNKHDYGAYFRDFKDVSNSIEKNSKILTDFIYLKEEAEDE